MRTFSLVLVIFSLLFSSYAVYNSWTDMKRNFCINNQKFYEEVIEMRDALGPAYAEAYKSVIEKKTDFRARPCKL